MGQNAAEAIPDIAARVRNDESKINVFAMLSLIVLATNDNALLEVLDRQAHWNLRGTPAALETFAVVRNTWTNCDWAERQELFQMIKNLARTNSSN